MSQNLASTSSHSSTLAKAPSPYMSTNTEAEEARKRQNVKNRATREAKKLGKKLDKILEKLYEKDVLDNKTQEEIMTMLVSSEALKDEDKEHVTRLAQVKLVQNRIDIHPPTQSTMKISNTSTLQADPFTKKQLKKQRQAAKKATATSEAPKGKPSTSSPSVDWSFAKDVVDGLTKRRAAVRAGRSISVAGAY